MDWSSTLRSTLRERALAWAQAQGLPNYNSLGKAPTVLFERTDDGQSHGNFHTDAWQAIISNTSWRSRLDKPHSQARALPVAKAATARELDSSNSSDALLMNCFCYPGAAKRILERLGFSMHASAQPEFGVKAKLPLIDESPDATEIDMRVGGIVFEAKLTEKDFTSRPVAHVQRYSGLATHFDLSALPSTGAEIGGYQLIRNVLAGADKNATLIVLLDQRRPDLLQEWWQIHSAIKDIALRLRCGFRTWQEVASVSPGALREFLARKYGL